ncbi:type II toxin-antitoxin system VapC family toxin [Fibrisoma limi]|uniref:type II toxin-antitoxin system VapC family toxin n=1 Tax=Fibrisoma limi TaxID=663275 RepID=UPI00058733F1|nr:type II toxin-antitoxin system VapC family toxin [Fibrisoma limi]
MNILLDTQALIWSLDSQERLTGKALQSIQDAEIVYVSPINFFEIAIKSTIGKSPTIKQSLRDIIEGSVQSGFVWLPLMASHIEAYTMIPFYDQHRDPFDRLILAIAFAEQLNIVSSDHNFSLYQPLVNIIW